MREILFKAKRIDNGEWVEGFYCKRKTGHYDNIGFHDEYKDCIIVEFSDGGITWCDVDTSTICQYTGLTDKNGQKIWENDVCRRTLLPTKRIKTNFRIAYVPLKCCLSAIDLEGINVTFLSDYINNQYEVEVIGNIFDNPELLNE